MVKNPQKRVFSARHPDRRLFQGREIWANRSILALLTKRDLKARYAGSMLGVMWNVIHPIVMIFIYILILGTIMSRKFGGFDRGAYAIHLCAGMIPWLVFQEITTRCSTTILENATLIKKVVFPEIVLHLSVAINAVLVHVISYTAFILILLIGGYWPGPQVLLCYPLLFFVALFALGVGLFFSVLNIYFRDVGQLVAIGLQFLFWFTPIVYFPSMLKGLNLAPKLMAFNPMLHFARLSQWMFGDAPEEAWFSLTSVAVTVVGSGLVFLLGLKMFNTFKRDMLDNI